MNITEFGKNKSTKDKLQKYCKICQRQLVRSHYSNNKDFYLKKAKRNATKYAAEARQYIYDYFSNNPCVDCGETDPIVLEFDHINPDEKEYNISYMIKSFPIDKIKKEIDKCKVRCANCHRLRTAYQFGWWIAKMDQNSFNKSCLLCNETICKDFNFCYKCFEDTKNKNNKQKINWPSLEKLAEKLKVSSYTAVAKEIGVSDNAIRKHIKNKYGKIIKSKYSKKANNKTE